MKDTTHSRTRFRSDSRAVSPVIGAVLMLAVLMLLITVLQTTAIPALNAQGEFQHNQEAQTDIVRLEATVDRVAAVGTGETATVAVGYRYPPRMVFVNPPPVAGLLRTTAARQVTIANARARGETGDVWNGTTRTYETTTLVYEPAYNEYGAAPETVYEPWAVFNRDREQTVALTPTDLVDGRRISLVALDGEFRASNSDTASVNLVPNSAPVRTVTVRNDTAPITVSVPTALRRDTWLRLLDDELDEAGTDADAYVTSVTCQQAPPAQCGVLTLTLEPGSYELALGELAVGSGASRERATYLTDVEGNATSVPEGGRRRLVVEARDRYDNPVGGVSVDATVTSGTGSIVPTTPTTEGDGRAAFVYEAPEDVTGSQSVTVTARFGDGARQRTVTFELQVSDQSTQTESVDPLSIEWAAPSVGEDDVYTFDAGVDNSTELTVESRPVVEGLGIEYVVDDPSIGTINTRRGSTDANGRDSITFTAKAAGTATVYAIGGGDVDPMTITVTNLTQNEPPSASFAFSPTSPAPRESVSFDGTGSLDLDGSISSYQWQFGDGTTATGATPTHTYASSGTYTVTLTVIDDAGATNNATRTVTVNERPSVDSLTITDTSKTTGTPKYAQFDVSYTLSDDLGLESIRYTVVRVSDGSRIIDTTTALSGTTASNSETIREPDQNANVRGESYRITITVTDSGGKTTTVVRTVTVQ